jgi:hypothetical protein
MSVGHVARLLEEAGISTVIIAVEAFAFRMEKMMLPRLVKTPHPMGRPMGAPGDNARQRDCLLAALKLLEDANQAGTVYKMPGSYVMEGS